MGKSGRQSDRHNRRKDAELQIGIVCTMISSAFFGSFFYSRQKIVNLLRNFTFHFSSWNQLNLIQELKFHFHPTSYTHLSLCGTCEGQVLWVCGCAKLFINLTESNRLFLFPQFPFPFHFNFLPHMKLQVECDFGVAMHYTHLNLSLCVDGQREIRWTKYRGKQIGMYKTIHWNSNAICTEIHVLHIHSIHGHHCPRSYYTAIRYYY